jgi:ABC-type bacteriocin/lantibiotic exporter with double-glycine peptidase domain
MRLSPLRLGVALLCLASVAFAAPPGGVWLDVPFVRQEKDGCGAASIAMVMQYWERERAPGSPVASDPHRILQKLQRGEAKGIFASAMERYLQRAGYRTFAFQGEWADFREQLHKGRPLIVALKPRGLGAALHYVVVTGLDEEEELVFVHDPAQRKLLGMERGDFEKGWKASGNWTLLALPKQGE